MGSGMTTHVDLATLAELVDGTLPAAEVSRVRAHLGECRSCMAAYADAVRFRAAWLANPDAFRAEEEAGSLMPEGLAGSSRSARGSRWRPDGKLLSIAAAAAVVLWLGIS